MASIFGKLFGGGGAAATEERMSVTTSEGTVYFSEEEKKAYDAIFRAVDSDGDGQIGGLEGAIFLRRSMLPDDDLNKVWKLASGGQSVPSLKRDDFMLACKLVACKQSHFNLMLSDLVAQQDKLLLADFRWSAEPDFTIVSAPEVSDSDMIVTVSDPKQVRDNALQSHVEYTVRMSSKLPQYAVKKSSVERRYRDFEWLHARLGQTFPSCVIPELPEKKMAAFQDVVFRSKRREALERLLIVAARHPIMSHSYDLYVFLTASPAAFDAAKEFIALSQATADEEDGILDKLLHGGGAVDQMPQVIDPAFARAASYHGNIMHRLEVASSASREFFKAKRQQCEDMRRLGMIVLQAAQSEQDIESFVAAQPALRKRDMEQRRLDAESRAQTAAFKASGVSSSTLETAASGSAGSDGAAGADSGDSSLALTKVDEDAMLAFEGHKKSQSERVDAFSQDHAAALFTSPDDGETEEHHDEGEQAASGAGTDALPSQSEDGHVQAGFETKPGTHANLYVRVGSEMCHAAQVEKNGLDRLERLLGADLQDQVQQERMLADARTRHRAMLELTERTYALKSRRDRALAVAMQKMDTEPELAKQAERLKDKAFRQLTKRQEDLKLLQQALKREMRRVMMRRRVFVSHSVLEHIELAQQLAGGRAAVWKRVAAMLGAETDREAAAARVSSCLARSQGAPSMAVHRKFAMDKHQEKLVGALDALRQLEESIGKAEASGAAALSAGQGLASSAAEIGAGSGGAGSGSGDDASGGGSVPVGRNKAAADVIGSGDEEEADDPFVGDAGPMGAGAGLEDEDLDGGGEI